MKHKLLAVIFAVFTTFVVTGDEQLTADRKVYQVILPPVTAVMLEVSKPVTDAPPVTVVTPDTSKPITAAPPEVCEPLGTAESVTILLPEVPDMPETAVPPVTAITADITASPDFTMPSAETGGYDNEWAFYLISADNPLPGDYEPNLRYVDSSYRIDERCADYAIKMLEAAKNDGIGLMVVSGYRTYQKQQQNFDAQVNVFLQGGYSEADARRLTAMQIALPGNSEHNAGLALDILNRNWYQTHTDINSDFENTREFGWLIRNSWKYGFIMRYPKDRTHITGIIYEPWHYRFVGVKRAKEIYESGLCLEEFIGQSAIDNKQLTLDNIQLTLNDETYEETTAPVTTVPPETITPPETIKKSGQSNLHQSNSSPNSTPPSLTSALSE